MKVRAVCGQAVAVLAAVFLLLGVPYLASPYRRSRRAGADAVGSASVILDAPSGTYLVFINRRLHTDGEALDAWMRFFRGGDAIIFEDVVCEAAMGDVGGMNLAESYRSRLPEHQMRVHGDASILLLSRMEHGCYDVVAMSKEFADRYGAVADDAVVLTVEGAGDAQD